jgi:hypothetical protein
VPYPEGHGGLGKKLCRQSYALLFGVHKEETLSTPALLILTEAVVVTATPESLILDLTVEGAQTLLVQLFRQLV